jgi:signal recognition particle receptor subunit beta
MHETGQNSGKGYRSLMATLAETPSFERVGAPLERVRRELWMLGEDMARQMDPADGATVGQALRTLQNQSCRIAVIGQVKAGKSTFISGLIGRPDLLPSDVNPWTTVVTSLHYSPSEQSSESAIFTFFGADEWTKIATGGGALRELTERLVPGFNAELLRLQLETMRRRAEQRLGEQFQTLLGQHHRYDAITRQLLEQYVTAGTEPSTANADAGRYADLTKAADLHFSGPRDGFPLSLVDTPGTNDPLLVRDEITRLSLASADIYIVVLTAQQPLSATDVALLRILRGLYKERVLVFINRIDQLRNPATDGQRLVAHVKARLAQEFPASQIPVILGSAYWGNCAQSTNPEDAAKADTDAFRAYSDSMWRGARAGDSPGPGQDTGDIFDMRERLLLSSGIPAVLNAVDGLLLRGSDAHTIQQLSAFLLELARSAEFAAGAELRSHERLARDESALHLGQEQDLEKWQKEFDQLTTAAEEVQEVITVFQGTLDKTVNQCAAELESSLHACVGRFMDYQIAQLTQAYQTQAHRVWTADPTSLRIEFEREYLHACRQSSIKLKRVEVIVRNHLATLLKEGVLEGLIDIGPANAPAASPPPNLAPISSLLSLDLEQPWWKAWLLQRPTLESRCAEFSRLIQAECAGMARDLAGLAEQSMRDQSATMARQITAVTLDVVNSMRRRSQALVPKLRQDASPENTAAQQRRAGQSQAIESTRTRLADWERLRGRLTVLSARCDRLLQDGGAPAS